MTDDKEKAIGLVIRRAKAMLMELHRRVDDHRERVRKYKEDGGPYHGVGPTLDDYWKYFNAVEAAIEEYEGKGGHVHIPFTAETRGSGVHEEIRESHESYGVLSFHRTHGGSGETHLFGSRVEHHPVTIRLEIKRAERHFNKDLSSDHIYGHGKPLIEIEMSAAQFTDSITMMNHGEGIPCTIRHVNGVVMETLPERHQSEQRMIVDNFRSKMADVRASAEDEIAELETILAKKSVGKKDRERIAWLFEKLIRSMSDNAAFTMSQFNEATQRLETEAKKEVEAYMNSILMAAGLEHLKAGAPNPEALTTSGGVKALEAGDDD